jgi:hypothetical protein
MVDKAVMTDVCTKNCGVGEGVYGIEINKINESIFFQLESQSQPSFVSSSKTYM